MKRYKVQRAENSQYKIIDTTLNVPIAWIDKKAIADRACKHFNQTYESSLTKKD
jgi:hypothetical protein